MMDCRRVIAIAPKLTWESFPTFESTGTTAFQGWNFERKHLEFAEGDLFEFPHGKFTTVLKGNPLLRKSSGKMFENLWGFLTQIPEI